MAKDTYKQKDPNELMKLLAEKKEQLVKTRLDSAIRKIKDVHAVAKLKKEIARIKTKISVKKLGI